MPAVACSNEIVTRPRKQYLELIDESDRVPSRVKILAFFRWADSVARSIQSGFRGEQGRGKRIALARDGSTRQIGAFSEQELCGVYESRAGLIAFLHRLGLEDHKPEIIPRKLAEAKHPTRARRLLGATPREARDPANERASAHQQSRRLRSRNQPTLRDRLPRSLRPDDRGPGH